MILKQPKLWLYALGASVGVHLALIGIPSLTFNLPYTNKLNEYENRIQIHFEQPEIDSSKEGSGLKPKKEVSWVSANQVLNDPRLGKIFSSYFHTLRQHIASSVQKYQNQWPINSKTIISFVLSHNGRLIQIKPKSLDTSSIKTATHAIQIMRASEPFPSFPSKINHEAISFQITFE